MDFSRKFCILKIVVTDSLLSSLSHVSIQGQGQFSKTNSQVSIVSTIGPVCLFNDKSVWHSG